MLDPVVPGGGVMAKEVHKCILCSGDIEHKKTPKGDIYWTTGNNAQPVAEGQCCDTCNSTVVIPTRLSLMTVETN